MFNRGWLTKYFRNILKKYFHIFFSNIPINILKGYFYHSVDRGGKWRENLGAGLISIRYAAAGEIEDVFLKMSIIYAAVR